MGGFFFSAISLSSAPSALCVAGCGSGCFALPPACESTTRACSFSWQ